MSRASFRFTTTIREMAVPVEVREHKGGSTELKIVWALAQFGCLVYLSLLVFRFGDQLLGTQLASTKGLESASLEVRILVWGLLLIRTVSQTIWGTIFVPYKISPSLSIGIAAFNGICDSLCVLGALYNRREIDPLKDSLTFLLFMFGILLERVAEFQRLAFKSRPENNNQMHIQGLYAMCVHPNYLGYIIWRIALVSVSHLWALQLIPAFVLYDFVRGDIPAQKERNTRKYGESFKRYWDSTPKLLPGIY